MSSAIEHHELLRKAVVDCRDRARFIAASATLMHSGRQNTLVRVADAGGQELCVRYRTAAEYWYEDCVKEPFIQSLQTVDLPRVVYADDRVRPQMLISEFVTGELLHEIVVDHAVATQLGGVLAQCHVAAGEATNYTDFVAGRRSTANWAAGFVGALRDTAERCGYASDDIERLLERCDADLSAADASLVLVHNDFHYKNVIRRPTGSLCVLDWDSAAIAPPEKDFVKLLDWSPGHSPTVDTTMAAYQNRTGRRLAKDLVELFRIFACLRQILFQSLAAGLGVDRATLSQGGFFADNNEQQLRLTSALERLGLSAWQHRATNEGRTGA